MNEQETTTDIIAEMRGGPIPQHRHDRVLLCHYANRIEAAHRRESTMSVNKKTHAEIIDWMRKSSTGPQELADMLDAAHKREVDALEQRRNELNAEVAAKDEVIKRLNDAISEERLL